MELVIKKNDGSVQRFNPEDGNCEIAMVNLGDTALANLKHIDRKKELNQLAGYESEDLTDEEVIDFMDNHYPEVDDG